MIRYHFTRHPQTEDELDRVYRGEAAELTDRGRQEMEKVVERLVEAHPQLIVTSSYPRSRRLGQSLAAAMGSITPIAPTELLVEVKKPSITLNRHRDDPEVEAVMDVVRDPTFFNRYRRYADEENRRDLEKRITALLDFLLLHAREVNATTVAVISHGKFLRAVKHFIEHEGSLRDFYIVERHVKHHNTGISTFTYGKTYRGFEGWELETWNSTSHLEPPSIHSLLRQIDRTHGTNDPYE